MHTILRTSIYLIFLASVAILPIRCLPSTAHASAPHPKPTYFLQDGILIPAEQNEPGPISADRVTPPKLVHSVTPDRPVGKPFGNHCVLSVVVGLDGKPSDITVLSPANSDLDEKVKAAVQQYQFKPATLDGAPYPSR